MSALLNTCRMNEQFIFKFLKRAPHLRRILLFTDHKVTLLAVAKTAGIQFFFIYLC